MGGKIVTVEQNRAFEARCTEHRRAWRAARDGSAGPASECRKIDPQTGRTAILFTLKPAGLATGAPTLGTPTLGIVPPGTVRKRTQRARGDAGDVVLPNPTVLPCDLVDAMVAWR